MIFRSPFADVSIPDVPLTNFVFQHAGLHGDRAALVDGTSGRTLTYAQLVELIARCAAGLYARGFRRGDVLAVFSPNVPEYAVAFHGAASLGGTVTTLNPLCTAEEVAKQLSDCGARTLVTVPPLLEKARAAAAESSVEDIYVFGEAEGAAPFAALLAHDAPAAPAVEIDARADVVALPYSSGTTGVAKGVMLTHRNLVANLLQLKGAGHEVGARESLICALPLFHIYGLHVIMNFSLYMGATVVTVPRFELAQVLALMERHRTPLAYLVPPLVLALARDPLVERYDLSRLRTVFSGAAPLGEALARECAARLGCRIKQGYGMTETSPATHITPPAPADGKLGSVGCCVPNTECKVVDVATGAELPAGERGEVCVRGPQVMKGYLGRPAETARVIDAEGWLHTGDIGYADAQGFFYIVDRAKELIKYKGFQVAPAELEALLLTHPSVSDAAVVPSPDGEAGEVPKAFVVRRAEVSAEELMSFVAARVSPHKKVRRVEFIEQIPKSPSGKILRRLLVAREREAPH